MLHASFCEWRTVQVAADRSAAPEARALWIARRVARESNAAQWDARKRELRAYHEAWLACWAAEADASATTPMCRDRLALDADATTRAVAVARCEAQVSAPLAGHPSFRACLAAHGHADARAPRWTRDDFGPRFVGPWVELTGLFAEQTRASGVWLGLAAPAACVAGALWIARPQSSTWAPSSTTRFGGTRK